MPPPTVDKTVDEALLTSSSSPTAYQLSSQVRRSGDPYPLACRDSSESDPRTDCPWASDSESVCFDRMQQTERRPCCSRYGTPTSPRGDGTIPAQWSRESICRARSPPAQGLSIRGLRRGIRGLSLSSGDGTWHQLGHCPCGFNLEGTQYWWLAVWNLHHQAIGLLAADKGSQSVFEGSVVLGSQRITILVVPSGSLFRWL